MQDPLLEPDKIECHRDGSRRRLCKKLRGRCSRWMKMSLVDRRTGETIDDWMCGDTWDTILNMEILQRLGGVQQATEIFRNEMARLNTEMLQQNSEIVCQNDKLLRINVDNTMRVINGTHNDSS